jgi:hypothetical protein
MQKAFCEKIDVSVQWRRELGADRKSNIRLPRNDHVSKIIEFIGYVPFDSIADIEEDQNLPQGQRYLSRKNWHNSLALTSHGGSMGVQSQGTCRVSSTGTKHIPRPHHFFGLKESMIT